jgi:hypothetical protein
VRADDFQRANLEVNMKKLVLAAAFAGLSTAAFAGAPADPIIEAPVVVEEAASSSAGIILPLLLIAVLVAAASD